jgi:ABC-2 type transport system ATP-binding protein
LGDAIVLENVRKTFGDKVAVEGMDLRVPQGSLYGFIGPNGAGKTTTIRMIMSIIFPDAGRLSVLGKASAVESKDRIGYLPEERGVYRKMKVGAFLRHMAALKGVSGPAAGGKVRDWLERVALGEVERKKCEELSKGMQQKVQFVASIIHEPELVILDEPFSGLDPVNRRLMRDLFLEQHKRGATVIFSTHQMHQAEELCDHIVMIHRGRKVLDDTLDAIRSQSDSRIVAVRLARGGVDPGPLSAIAGVRHTGGAGLELEVSLSPEADAPRVIAEVAQRVPVESIALRRPNLEDIFVEIATDAGDASVREALAGVGAGEIEGEA